MIFSVYHIVFIVCVSIILLIIGVILYKQIKRKKKIISEVLDIYNKDCDPQLFIKNVQARIPVPEYPDGSLGYSVFNFGVAPSCQEEQIGIFLGEDSYVVSLYTQALIDLGRYKEADKFIVRMEHSIEISKNRWEICQLLINTYRIYKKTKDYDKADKCLKKLQNKMPRFSTKKQNIVRNFLNKRKRALKAVSNEDYKELIQVKKGIIENKRKTKRAKTEAAYDLAICYHNISDNKQAAYYLNYVIDNGNRLACVNKAQVLLATLDKNAA